MNDNTSKNGSGRQILARICITIPASLLFHLDSLRNDIPRSKFIQRILEKFADGGKKICN